MSCWEREDPLDRIHWWQKQTLGINPYFNKFPFERLRALGGVKPHSRFVGRRTRLRIPKSSGFGFEPLVLVEMGTPPPYLAFGPLVLAEMGPAKAHTTTKPPIRLQRQGAQRGQLRSGALNRHRFHAGCRRRQRRLLAAGELGQ